MDIDEFEKNLGNFFSKKEKSLEKLLTNSFQTQGDNAAIIKGQAMILHRLDPSKTEYEYRKELNDFANKRSVELWDNFLRSTLDTDEED